MTHRRYHILMNPHSGAVQASGITPRGLADRMAAAGLEVAVDTRETTTFDERIEMALASDAEVVVAAGGDGTATALASALRDSGKILAVLPLGTANLLARDLGIPLDLDQWIAGLDSMVPRHIDVCDVNGIVFLHKAVIGVIPELAAGREHVRGEGIGAKLAFVGYCLRRVARARRFALQIGTESGQTRIERVQAVAVASNAYDEGLGRVFSRERLDTGQLTLYILRHLTIADMLRLSLGMLSGHWRDDEALAIETARSLTIDSRKPRLQAMIDGEVMSLKAPLRFAIHPRSLSVLAPAIGAERAEEV